MAMQKSLIGAFCAALLLAMTAMPGVAGNVLINPDFETGDLTGWDVFGVSAFSNVTIQTPDNGPSAGGIYSAFADNHAEAIGLTLKQTTAPGTAIPGTVDYSFDIKLGEAALGGVFFVEIFAEQSGVGIIGGSGLLGNYTPADWTTFSGSFEAPAGTDFLTIQFMANTGAVVGSVSTMSSDNVVLEQPGAVPTQATSWSNIKSLFN